MSAPPPERSRLTPELLLRAYAAGIFPMSESRDDLNIFWVDPEMRCILPMESFHVSRSLKKTIRSNKFEIRCNTAFENIIRECASSIKGRGETWINDEIIRAFCELHAIGFAHSVECWRNGALVGGLYGVGLAGAFCGESMYSRDRDASKVALVHLVARLRLGGIKLLDAQFMTEHLRQFGAVELPARDYLELLNNALDVHATFVPNPDASRLNAELEALFNRTSTKDE